VAGPGTVASRTTAFWIDRNVDVAAYQSGNAMCESASRRRRTCGCFETSWMTRPSAT
jgi:hypothetical protein